MIALSRLAAVLVLAYAPFVAAEGGRFERLLFPLILTEQPGAFGTSWSSEFTVRNEANSVVEMFTSECQFRCDTSRCAVVVCGGTATPPHSTFPDLIDLTKGEIGNVPNPASLLYVEKEHADQVFTSLRVKETSSPAGSQGFEVPVVRERELFGRELWLPAVPVSASGRTHLRIFGVESPSGSALVRVLVYAKEGDTPLLDKTLALAGITPLPGDYDQPQPSFALIDLTQALPTTGEPVRVLVTPLSERLRFWAMASIADNVTQQVTIISPQ